jgi:hypothetical protein
VQHVEGNLSAAAGTCTLRPDTRKLLITCNRSSVSFRCKSLLFHMVSAKLCDNVLRIFHSETFRVPAGCLFRRGRGELKRQREMGRIAAATIPPECIYQGGLISEIGFDGRSSSPVVNRRELRFSLRRLRGPLQSQGTTVR